MDLLYSFTAGDQSDQPCKFLYVHIALCGSWSTDSWGCGPKTGGVLDGVISLSTMQTPFVKSGQISEFHIFAP